MISKIIRHYRLWPYCFEALIDLMICQYFILCKPFSAYAKKYGYPHCETLQEEMNFAVAQIDAVRCVMRVLPKMLPWKSVCLDQAMAAQRMLKRRGLQSTLYFGVLPEKNSLTAHAWLRCGRRWVVGYSKEMRYKIVGTYASGI